MILRIHHPKVSKNNTQQKYFSTEKGQLALQKARKIYDEKDIERRRMQKKEYMRRKRLENPNYCKWK